MGQREDIGIQRSQKKKKKSGGWGGGVNRRCSALSKIVFFLCDDGEAGNNQKHFEPAWSSNWKRQKTRPSHQSFCFEMVQKFCHNRFFFKSFHTYTSGENCTSSKNTSLLYTQLWGQLLTLLRVGFAPGTTAVGRCLNHFQTITLSLMPPF